MEFMVRSLILFISLFTLGFLNGTAFALSPKKPQHRPSSQPRFIGRKTNNIPKARVSKPTTRNTPKAQVTKPTIRNTPKATASKPSTRSTPKAQVTKPTTRTKLSKWLKKQLKSDTFRTIKDTIKDIGVSEIKKLINLDPSPAEAAGNAPGNEEPTRNVLFSPDDNSNDGFVAIQDSSNEYPNIYQEFEKEEDQQVDQEEED
ncbi:hypothetical protein DSO57_1025908 [Entomophthora muscae]|uniref:Uncharacterized protein n=1 Tax=Entomophthora muscae TaxID=34485 RepID=A0ACC2RH06_9FUNG|nr:hypothetical protein DSO57_1025908 [Entomophthora muscae]